MVAISSIDSGDRIIILNLVLAYLVGLSGMYGLIYRNGYYNALTHLREHGPHVLPGSKNPILTKYTGIGVVDQLLTLGDVMFANITDGSSPELSLYAFQFAGQLVPVLTVIMIEARRVGNKRNILSLSMLWAFMMQILGYGFTMPLYGIYYILTSRAASKIDSDLARNIRVLDMTFLETLPSSIMVGYILPSVLMVLPLSSTVLHQWLGGFWQGFPLWVLILQHAFGKLHGLLKHITGEDQHYPKGPLRGVASRLGELRALHHVYLFAFLVAAITHIGTASILSVRKLFPKLFSPVGLATLNFQDVFLPPMFYSCANMQNMARGAQNFFQYDQYVGSFAAIAWAVALHRKSRKGVMTARHWAWLVGEIFGVSLLAGPGGALVSLMWHRDEHVIGDDELHEQKTG